MSGTHRPRTPPVLGVVPQQLLVFLRGRAKASNGVGIQEILHEELDRRQNVLGAQRRKRPWQRETTLMRGKGSSSILRMPHAFSLRRHNGVWLHPRRVRKRVRHCLLAQHHPQAAGGTTRTPGLRPRSEMGLRTPRTLCTLRKELGRETKRRTHALRATAARPPGRGHLETRERLWKGAGWHRVHPWLTIRL